VSPVGVVSVALPVGGVVSVDESDDEAVDVGADGEDELSVGVGVGVGVATDVCLADRPDDGVALGDTRGDDDLVADEAAGGEALSNEDGDWLGVEVVEASIGAGSPPPPPLTMIEMPPTGDGKGHREVVDARLTPVMVAAASAHKPISRELGTLRRQASTRCQLERATGGSGSSSLRTISSHCGPAWIRALTTRAECDDGMTLDCPLSVGVLTSTVAIRFLAYRCGYSRGGFRAVAQCRLREMNYRG
jgi:hypothetical protein